MNSIRIPGRGLTEKQIEHFRKKGFVSNVQVIPDNVVANFRRQVSIMLETQGPAGNELSHRHLDDPTTFKICSMPGLVEKVSNLLGPNVILWHSRYFDKRNGDPLIPWHQDSPFWPIEPDNVISAWIALDPVDRSNGCLEVLPGSHLRRIQHVASPDTGRFGQKADPSMLNTKDALPICLQPGEAVFFDRLLVHSSGVNPTAQSRLALSIRFATPEVKIRVEQLQPRVENYRVMLLKGRDEPGLNPSGVLSRANRNF